MIQMHKENFNCEELPEILDFTYAYLSEINRRKTTGEPVKYFRFEFENFNSFKKFEHSKIFYTISLFLKQFKLTGEYPKSDRVKQTISCMHCG